MDRTQLMGITLLSVMFITYMQLFSPKPPAPPQPQSQASVASPGPALPSPAAPSSLAPTRPGKEQTHVLENDAIKVTFSSKGGCIQTVVLKNYQDQQHQPLTLLDAQSSRMGFLLPLDGKSIHTNEFFFNTNVQEKRGESSTVTFTLPLGPGQHLRQVYALAPQGHTLTHTWEVVGLGPVPLQFVWQNCIKQAEKDLAICRNKATVTYYLADGTFGQLKETAQKPQEKKLPSRLQWVGIKQHFFTAGLIAPGILGSGAVATRPAPQDGATVKEANVCLHLLGADEQPAARGEFTFYFGPNDYHTLRPVAPGFTKNIALGWPVVRWINQYAIIPVFAFLTKHISNHGLIIIVLVLLLKCLLLPLSYKSYLSMAQMRVLKPALEALKKKHGSDLQQQQLAQMALYREVGINPLSGCLPVLLQMPLLLAMFNFFPNTIALRQQAFLWASDLSTYDAIFHLPFRIPAYGSHVSLFTLLMTASTILYTWSNDQLSATTQGPMKALMYVLPLTFMFVLNSLPAGLSFYYFVANLVTFGQQSLIRRLVDDEKIKQKLAKNKAKKSGLKARLQLSLAKPLQRKKT